MILTERLSNYLVGELRLNLTNYNFVGMDCDFEYFEEPILYYDLFYSTLKISTKEQMYAWSCKLLHCNQGLYLDMFKEILLRVSDANMGLCVRSFSEEAIKSMSIDIYNKMKQGILSVPLAGRNKRKIIFNPSKGMTIDEKLSIIGSTTRRAASLTEASIYEFVEGCNPDRKITNKYLSERFNVSPQTISAKVGTSLREYIRQHNKTAKDVSLMDRAMDVLDAVERASLRHLQEMLKTRNVAVLKQAIQTKLSEGKELKLIKGGKRL